MLTQLYRACVIIHLRGRPVLLIGRVVLTVFQRLLYSRNQDLSGYLIQMPLRNRDWSNKLWISTDILRLTLTGSIINQQYKLL